ncbi:hypothetical protein FRB91_005239, partial [Serendipita sp. 411]
METIADVIYTGAWWRNKGLRTLNLFIIFVELASAINGYDSSVLNGLQILPEFKKHFNSPDGSTLGFMSASQNFGGLV